ncbi:MAG: YIP1 family protein [Candidatus Ranarchaeia archaeon]
MVKCPSCGTEVSLDTVTCPHCGAKVQDEILERVIPIFRRPRSGLVEPMGSIKRMIRIFYRPADVYMDYVNSPDFFTPFLFMIIPLLLMSLVYPAFWTHFIILDADPAALPIMIFVAWIGIFIFEFIVTFFLVFALVTILFIGARLAGGKGTWRGGWGITLYAMSPLIIARLIILVLIWITPLPGAAAVSIHDSSILTSLLFNSPQWQISLLIERVFFVWVGLLAAIGLRENYKLGIIPAVLVASIGVFVFVNLSVIGFSVPII